MVVVGGWQPFVTGEGELLMFWVPIRSPIKDNLYLAPKINAALGQTHHRICCSAAKTIYDHFKAFGQQPVKF
jgi:hypothetical protein